MENQNDRPEPKKNPSKKETLKFQLIDGGGAIVVIATIIAAAIGAAFVSHRARTRTKNQRNKSYGADHVEDDKSLQKLHDFEKFDVSPDINPVDKFVDKHETNEEIIKEKFECKRNNEEIEKEKDESEGTSMDSSTESNGGAVWPSEKIDHRQLRKEELAFGSLIEIQETDSNMIVTINKKQERCCSLAIAIGTVEKLAMENNININGNDINSREANDFSFWNDKLNKEEDAVVKEASEVSDRTDDIFEFEGQEEHVHVQVVKVEEDREEYDGIAGIEEEGEEKDREDAVIVLNERG